MFTTNRSPASSAACMSCCLSTETSNRGGSSDTEAMELAVMPQSRPSGPRVVSTETPAAKRPRSWRNCEGSTPVTSQGQQRRGARSRDRAREVHAVVVEPAPPAQQPRVAVAGVALALEAAPADGALVQRLYRRAEQ